MEEAEWEHGVNLEEVWREEQVADEQGVNGGDESHLEAGVSRNGTKRHRSYYALLRFKRMRESEKIRTKNARAKLLSLSCVGSDLVTKERV